MKRVCLDCLRSPKDNLNDNVELFIDIQMSMIHIWVKITGCRSDFFYFYFYMHWKISWNDVYKNVYSGCLQWENTRRNFILGKKITQKCCHSLKDGHGQKPGWLFFTNNPQESASTLVSLLQCSVCDPVLFSVSWWLDSHRLALNIQFENYHLCVGWNALSQGYRCSALSV